MAPETWNRHRHDNINRVVESLWRDGVGSRADLARRTRLDRSTVGSIVDILLTREIVREIDIPVPERAGRPPIGLDLNRATACSVGIELLPDRVRGVATDLAGVVLAEREMPAAPASILDGATALVESLSGAVPAGQRRLVGVGVAVPGIVDTASGTILTSRALGIETATDAGARLAAATDLPVGIYNDADACAIGELEYGASKDLLVVLLRYQGAPVRINAGLGLVLDGNLRESHSGAGREFRSPFVALDEPDQFAVNTRLRTESSLNFAAVAADFADELAVSLAFLVHALDVRDVVVAGDTEPPGLTTDTVIRRLRQQVQRSTVRPTKQELHVSPPQQDRHAVAWGAAAAAVRRAFALRRFPLEKTGHSSPVGSIPPQSSRSTPLASQPENPKEVRS